jgi:dipeptidyl aminopeptidase/acylaminoacyl peptidase
VQFWTSRGLAVLDVNYSGSTGYGRDYRRRLNGKWGVADVDDCCAGALFLANQGQVDRSRMAIKGGSAGGYTALACLATRNEVFSAGVVYYGISDLELLLTDSPKFESRSLQTLVGPYPGRRDLYRARSPVEHSEELRCPLILFQGDEDRVVPPAQTLLIYDAVRRRGLPAALLRFSGEGHGFRRAESLERAQAAELYFLSRIFRFALQDSVEAIAIENLGAET